MTVINAALCFVACLLVVGPAAAAGDNIGQSTIGYPSPDAALQVLRARPDVNFKAQGRWLIAEDRSNQTV